MDFDRPETCAAVVEAADAALATPDDAWKALAAAGLLALAVPERLGGQGLGVLESLTVLTEVGRRGLALPALATLALGVLPLVRWGTQAQQDELLAGTPILTAALREPGRPFPTTPATTSTELAVTGTVVGVPCADRARAILVPVTLANGSVAVALVAPTAPGVVLTPTPASSPTDEFTVTLLDAPALGLLPSGAVADLHQLALAGACALGDGLVAGALALTTAHIGTREQFGRPIATFQAATVQIADVYIAARGIHLAAQSAGWRLHTGRPAESDVAVAALWLAREAPVALRTCHHLHGGVGLDITYPLHRYSALVKDLVRFVGGVGHRLDALGELDVH